MGCMFLIRESVRANFNGIWNIITFFSSLIRSFNQVSKILYKVHYFITKPHKQLQYKPISGSHQLNKQKWKSQFIINCINLQYSFEEKKLRLVRDTINSKQHKLKDFWKCLIQIREKYTKNTASQTIILNVLDPFTTIWRITFNNGTN